MRKFISMFLIVAMLVGIVGTYPITATANEEVTVPDRIFTTAELATIGNYGVSASQESEGVKVTYSDSAKAWARIGVNTKSTLDEKGVRIEVTDIETASDTYAFAMHFGNYTNVYFDKRGYVLVYENSGKFSIVATKADGSAVANHKIVQDEVQLDALTGNLTIDIKLVEDNYVIIVNGHSFTIPAVYSDTSYNIQATGWAQFSFAFVGASRAQTAFPGATYTIKSIAPITDAEPQQPMKAVAYTSTFHKFRDGEEMEVPFAPEGYVFAGWYYDEECESYVSQDVKTLEAEEKVYAKFVPEAVLSVKAQARKNSTDDTKLDLRLVTTVDSYNYKKVGFLVTKINGETIPYPLQKVYSSLNSVNFAYVPTYFNQLSISFATINMTGITVSGEGIDPAREIPVQAYWITLDGTTVYGPQSGVSISKAASYAGISY